MIWASLKACVVVVVWFGNQTYIVAEFAGRWPARVGIDLFVARFYSARHVKAEIARAEGELWTARRVCS